MTMLMTWLLMVPFLKTTPNYRIGRNDQWNKNNISKHSFIGYKSILPTLKNWFGQNI